MTAKVAEIIDGHAIVAAHGQREMPVFGERYRRAIEMRARAQIGALVKYIEEIQAK